MIVLGLVSVGKLFWPSMLGAFVVSILFLWKLYREAPIGEENEEGYQENDI